MLSHNRPRAHIGHRIAPIEESSEQREADTRRVIHAFGLDAVVSRFSAQNLDTTGLMPRSTNRASCLRRIRFSARIVADRPGQMAQVVQWVMLAGNEIQTGLQYGRRGTMRGVWSAGTLEQCQAFGRIALNALSSRLREHDWLAHGRTTIADIACFPYVDSAPEMGLTHADFPGVAQWLARCRALPRWPQDWPPDLSHLRKGR